MTNTLPSPLFDGLQELQNNQGYEPRFADSTQAQDYEQAKQFLLSYRGSLDTFNSYRREVERFLQWCQLKAQKNLAKIKREDFEQFLAFCQDPPKSWIALKVEKRFMLQDGIRVPNPAWRPFVVKITKRKTKAGEAPDKDNYQLSEKAFKSLFAVISTFYNYLLLEDHVSQNPVLLIRQKSQYFRKRQTAAPVRRLSEMQWGYVIETVEQLAAADPDRHERTLFMMNLLYGMYLRISELVASKRWMPTMGDFHRDSEGRWWFLTVGKGNKERKVSVSDAMLAALKRYRVFLGLTPLPLPDEQAPLLTVYHSNKPLTSTRYIRELVQFCFDQAYERLLKDNQHEEAEQLSAATVHWLRHTGISDDVKTRPREHVRDDAGHSSSSITDKYIDVELRERHRSAKDKPLKPDFIDEPSSHT